MAAGGVSELEALPADLAVRGSADATLWVARALAGIAPTDEGQVALAADDGAPALVALVAEPGECESAGAAERAGKPLD